MNCTTSTRSLQDFAACSGTGTDAGDGAPLSASPTGASGADGRGGWRSCGGLRVVVLSRDQGELVATELDELVGRALEPNPFVEPWLLLPALKHLERSRNAFLVLTRSDAGRLLGAFCLQREERFRGLPIAVLTNWKHLFCFLGSPLLDRDAAHEVLTALAEWLESGSAPSRLIEWHGISWEGGFGQALRSALCNRRGWSADHLTYKRAVLERGVTPTDGPSAKHMKEYRRLERRLADLGEVEYRTLAPVDDLREWMDIFLALEFSGWKGREGTALACSPEERAFFLDAAGKAHKRGQLQMLLLTVGKRPVAAKCNFISRGGAFAFKIAFDEEFARYSPGVLLEVYNARVFLDMTPAISWMDSCAAPDHPMIDRLWSQRREIGWCIAASGAVGRALFSPFQKFGQPGCGGGPTWHGARREARGDWLGDLPRGVAVCPVRRGCTAIQLRRPTIQGHACTGRPRPAFASQGRRSRP